MKLTLPRFAALLAGLFVVSYLVAFFVQRQAVVPRREVIPPAVEAPTRDEDAARVSAASFAQTADRVTIGSGILPEAPAGGLAGYDQLFRQTATLPDGEEKMRLAQEVGAIRDRAAAPVLLDWAVVTTDRALLRSALDALGSLADAELIAEMVRRFTAAFRADDRPAAGPVRRPYPRLRPGAARHPPVVGRVARQPRRPARDRRAR